MNSISFFVPGHPATSGSKRAFIPKGWQRAIITDTSGRKGKDWRGDVKRFALEAYQGPPLTGPLSVTFHFWLPRPKAHFKTGRMNNILRSDCPWWHEKKPDVLKMARAVEDALTGILWVDDAQIASECLTKRYAEKIGCMIEIQRLGEE